MKTVSAEHIKRLPAVRVSSEQYEALYRNDIGGSVKSIAVDFVDHSAIVTTASGCVDMTGCIATVMMLDPNIENIQTIDGRAFLGEEHCRKDTQYVKDQARGWCAIRWDGSSATRGEYYGTEFIVKRLQSLLLAALRATKKIARVAAT